MLERSSGGFGGGDATSTSSWQPSSRISSADRALFIFTPLLPRLPTLRSLPNESSLLDIQGTFFISNQTPVVVYLLA